MSVHLKEPSKEVIVSVEPDEIAEKERRSLEKAASEFGCSLPTLYSRWIHTGYLKTAYLRRQRFTTAKWMQQALVNAAKRRVATP